MTLFTYRGPMKVSILYTARLDRSTSDTSWKWKGFPPPPRFYWYKHFSPLRQCRFSISLEPLKLVQRKRCRNFSFKLNFIRRFRTFGNKSCFHWLESNFIQPIKLRSDAHLPVKLSMMYSIVGSRVPPTMGFQRLGNFLETSLLLTNVENFIQVDNLIF